MADNVERVLIGNIKGPKGDRGDDGSPGAAGPQGAAGPNEITNATDTDLSGILCGDGANVSAVTGGTAGQVLTKTATGYAWQNVIAPNAGAHNSIYRGKYLGNAVTEAQYASISAGTFDDIFIGDYWTINGVNWRVAALDYYLHYGDTECTTHHVVVVPDTCIVTNAKMNRTNIVTGAYVGSDYYTGANSNTAREDAGNIIKAAFGSDHILAHRVYLTNFVPEGKGYASSGGWYNAHPADLMSEEMVYGCKEFKNEVAGENLAGNSTVDHGQLPLFRHDHSRICIRADWWLRGVANPTCFSLVYNNGRAAYVSASYTNGVRPASAICA